MAGCRPPNAMKVAARWGRQSCLQPAFSRPDFVSSASGRSHRKAVIFNGPVVVLIDGGTAGAAEIVASALLERNRGQVLGEKSFGAGAEQQLFTLRDGDGLLLTTVKWASGSGKPFLGEDRSHSGVTPSMEVKRPELTAAISPEDLTGSEDESLNKPSQPGDKQVTPEATPKPTEDSQMKKALELLREGKVTPQKQA